MRTIFFLLTLSAVLSVNTLFSDEIVKDWIAQDKQFQTANNIAVAFSPEHTTRVIVSALALAERIKKISNADIRKIDSITESLRALNVGSESSESLYMEARKLKREIVRCNPHLVKLDRLLFLKKHDANDTQFHMCDQFYGFTAVPGGGLYVLENPQIGRAHV